MHARVSTPRPQIPDLPSSNESYLSDDSFSYTDNDTTSWHVEKLNSKHRSSEVTGWMCIPKSVVMATALNLKHLQRLEKGRPLTILPDSPRKQRPLSEKTLAYIETQAMDRNKRKVLKKPPNDLIVNGCYEDFLDENMTDVSSLKERFGVVTPERFPILVWKTNMGSLFKCSRLYKTKKKQEHFVTVSSSNGIVQLNTLNQKYESVDLHETNKKEIWKRYLRDRDETKSLELALPSWKRSFLPPSTEVQEVLVRVHNAEKKGNRSSFFHSRPLTADFNLRAQSKKASKLRDSRPLSSSSSRSFRAMKTLQERKVNTGENVEDKRLPGYPPRIIRNRNRRKSPMCNKRPIMTMETSWFPISFNDSVKGKLIKFGWDSYGYQTVAEYEELCHSLNDGMVVVEQQMEVGDIYKIKILDTDRRMGLLYIATKSECRASSERCFASENSFDKVPGNRIISKSFGRDLHKWKYSYEISNLKIGDHLLIMRDNVGRIKCTVNANREQLLLYLDNSDPLHLALCLGLGVTKVQLLGCQKNNSNLMHAEAEMSAIINHDESPFLEQESSNHHCSFCGESSQMPVTALKSPYACDHIAVCENCCNRVECRICDAPLCWAACPLCDNRLQSY